MVDGSSNNELNSSLRDSCFSNFSFLPYGDLVFRIRSRFGLIFILAMSELMLPLLVGSLWDPWLSSVAKHDAWFDLFVSCLIIDLFNASFVSRRLRR